MIPIELIQELVDRPPAGIWEGLDLLASLMPFQSPRRLSTEQ
jgi:hypothetical protein